MHSIRNVMFFIRDENGTSQKSWHGHSLCSVKKQATAAQEVPYSGKEA
jgi:hypothetical protein